MPRRIPYLPIGRFQYDPNDDDDGVRWSQRMAKLRTVKNFSQTLTNDLNFSFNFNFNLHFTFTNTKMRLVVAVVVAAAVVAVAGASSSMLQEESPSPTPTTSSFTTGQVQQ